jgi:adenylate cyclase
MAIEIEHKFLLANDSWRTEVSHASTYKQGYLTSAVTSSIRVRVSGDQAWLNIKSATIGNQRQEYEYGIPLLDAETMLATLCVQPIIEKIRHFVQYGEFVWEIDEFLGANTGLVVAEIELPTTDTVFDKPSWLGEEVTHDMRYYNNNLALMPYNQWC